MLQAIAKEGCAKAVTSQAFVKKHALDSASTVQSALRVLLEKDIVTADNGQYRISDFFFSHWLQENY